MELGAKYLIIMKITLALIAIILLQQKVGPDSPAGPNEPSPKAQRLEAADFNDFSAVGGPPKSVIIGSKDPNTGFKLQAELTSKGAAIRYATLSEFDDRNYRNPQPLVLLSPVRLGSASEIRSMANTDLVLIPQNRQLALDRLSWESFDVETAEDGAQTARFAVVINDPAGQSTLKLVKTYRLSLGSYLIECNLVVQNLSSGEQQVHFNLAGPTGISREGDRGDTRKIVGGFLTPQGKVVPASQDISSSFFAKFRGDLGLKDATERYQQALRSGNEDEIRDAKRQLRIGHNLPDNFLWAAITNKYFTAILRPVPGQGENYCNWLSDKTAGFYNPDQDARADSGDETIGVNLEIALATLAPLAKPAAKKPTPSSCISAPKTGPFSRRTSYIRLWASSTPSILCRAAAARRALSGLWRSQSWP